MVPQIGSSKEKGTNRWDVCVCGLGFFVALLSHLSDFLHQSQANWSRTDDVGQVAGSL